MMSSVDEHQISQPTFSGYNVEEGKSFLLYEDVFSFEHSSVGSSHEEDSFSEDDADSSESSDMSLAEELRAEMLRDEITRSVYMPLHVLRNVMTRYRVVRELERHYRAAQVQEYASLICPWEASNHAIATSVEAGAYTKVFATLARLNKCQDIHGFVSECLSDEKLPFRRRDDTRKMRIKFPLFEDVNSATEIQACKHWTADDRERFFGIQKEFLVHFFERRPGRNETIMLGPQYSARIWVDEVMGTTYLPWKEKRMSTELVEALPVLSPHMSSSYAGGAYGLVSPFEIEDEDHDFVELLDSVSSSKCVQVIGKVI